METVKPAVQGACCVLDFVRNRITARVEALFDLKTNMTKLTTGIVTLTGLQEDIKTRLKSMEDYWNRRSSLVSDWLKKVDSFRDKHTEFSKEFDERAICCFAAAASFDSCSNCRFGWKAVRLLEEFQNLMDDGRSFSDAQLVLPRTPRSVKALVPNYGILGQEEELLKIEGCLKDDEVQFIGVYGMGGIGKSSLLEGINNRFAQNEQAGSRDFDYVFLVTISREARVQKIQKQIGEQLRKLHITDEGNAEAQAEELCDFLNHYSFLLLMDDLWEIVNLQQVGIPLANIGVGGVGKKKRKVVLTSRSKQVCGEMGVKDNGMVEMRFLSHDCSWELFLKQLANAKIIEEDSRIKEDAQAMTEACGGLPLALITVGKAMAITTSWSEWKQSRKELESSQFRGMDDVLFQLKFSFDKLQDAVHQSCLLYCSLFPKDMPNIKERLIELLVGENFVDGDIHSARDKAHVVISKLVAASLLEVRENKYMTEVVRMHDCVRDMALGLTNGKQKVKELGYSDIFKVCSAMSSGRLPRDVVRDWENAKRILLTYSVTELPGESEMPVCANLVTLLAKHMRIEHIPASFFKSLPSLRVLDLSHAHVKKLPAAIESLVGLQFLDLSWTPIQELPKELRTLLRLRQLNLEGTRDLSKIPSEAISGLRDLKMLNLFQNDYPWAWDTDDTPRNSSSSDRQVTLRDLDNLQEMLDLRLCIADAAALECLLSSSANLPRCVHYLDIRGSQTLDSLLSKCFAKMEILGMLKASDMKKVIFSSNNLRVLHELRLLKVEHIVVAADKDGDFPLPYLSRLTIDECQGIVDLTWVSQLPCLEFLNVTDCLKITAIVRGNGKCFQKLKVLSLLNCEKLQSICDQPMPFDFLEILDVNNCPKLKKLPLGPESAKKIKRVSGQQAWWDELQWDNEENQSRLSHSFILTNQL